MRDFGDSWLKRLADKGRINPVSVTLLYFLMTHGAGGLFALPALTKRLRRGVANKNRMSTQDQAESVVKIIFDGLLTR